MPRPALPYNNFLDPVYEKYPNARIEMWWRDKTVFNLQFQVFQTAEYFYVLKAIPSIELQQYAGNIFQFWKDIVAGMLQDLEAEIKKQSITARVTKELCDGKNS